MSCCLSCRELWIEAAKRVFQGIESQLGNKISYAGLTDMIRQKVPEREIEYAVEDALVAGGYAGMHLHTP